MLKLVVENDVVLRLIQVLLDPDVPEERCSAFAHYFSHDVPDFAGWRAEVRERLPNLWPATIVLASTPEELRDAIVDADGVIVEDLPVGEAELACATRLRFVQKFGTVTRNVDPAACEKHGLPLLTFRRRVNLAVAEHTLTLLLALAKKLNRIDGLVTVDRLRSAGYNPQPFDIRHTPNANWGRVAGLRTVFGARLGLLGLGEIGREMARLGCGTGMDVCYYQRNQLDPDEENRLGVHYRPFNQLLAESDYLSIHVPLGPQTRDLLDHDALARLQPGAMLLNTSRAAIVNHAALVQSVQSGHLGGLAMDVLYEEPAARDEPLLDFDNVILTPHLAEGPRWSELLDAEYLLAGLIKYIP